MKRIALAIALGALPLGALAHQAFAQSGTAPSGGLAPESGGPTGTGGTPTGGPTTTGGGQIKGTFSSVDANAKDQAKIDNATSLLKRSNYAQALPLFNELRQTYPESNEFQANYALCLYETGKLGEAQEIYEKILQVDQDNILGLLSVARISAKIASGTTGEHDPQKQQEALERARDKLRQAARQGANCLRAIKTYPEFDRFKTEVSLEVQLIHEPQYLLGPAQKDPFRNMLPSIKETGPSEGTGDGGDGTKRESDLSEKEQQELVNRLERLLAQVDALVKANDYEGIGKIWPQIEDIINDKRIRTITVIDRLKRLKDKSKAMAVIVEQLLLKAYYAQGEKVITQMQVDFEGQQYTKVFQGWDELTHHTERMTASNPKFQQSADDLRKRGQEWQQKASILNDLDKIKFDITGIVSGASISKAIVNNRVLAENDLVYDQRGNPITDLRVSAIKKRRVRFTYRGLEFERPLVTVNR